MHAGLSIYTIYLDHVHEYAGSDESQLINRSSFDLLIDRMAVITNECVRSTIAAVRDRQGPRGSARPGRVAGSGATPEHCTFMHDRIYSCTFMEPPHQNVQKARRATQGFFLVCGIAAGAWAPMVPFAKARLALDDGQLGAVLLCMGLGSAVTMPLSGWISHRHGSRIVIPIASALICVALPLLALAPSTMLLGATLAFFGAALGMLDVAMNAHAVEVERLHGRPLMSGFHALYSVGGLAGPA